MKITLFILQRWPVLSGVGLVASLLGGIGSMSLLLFLIHSGGRQLTTGTQVILFLMLALCSIGGRVSSRMILSELSGRSSINIRKVVIQKILSAPLVEIERLGPDRLDAALLEEVSQISRSIPRIMQVAVSFSMIVLGLGYLYAKYPAAALALSCAMLTGIPIYISIRKRAGAIVKRRVKLWEKLYRGLSTLARGVKDLKMDPYRKDHFLNINIFPILDTMKIENKRSDMLAAGVLICGQSFAFFVIFIIMFFPSKFGLQDGIRPSIIIIYLLTPLDLFLSSIGDVYEGSKALDRVNKIIDILASSAEEGPEVTAQEAPAFREIAFNDICYRYADDETESGFSLGPVSLSLAPGKVIFLTGGNGSGKTTLFKLLSGLYCADGGAILIDGQEIDASNTSILRSMITAIFDDFHLFDEIIPRPHSLSSEDIQKELVSLKMNNSIFIEDNRLSRIKLSKGQKKRLALLNAYIDDRPVFLFDEWAADQDPHFRKVFYKEILPKLKSKGKAILAITHDEHYFEDADEVIELRNGLVHRRVFADSPKEKQYI